MTLGSCRKIVKTGIIIQTSNINLSLIGLIKKEVRDLAYLAEYLHINLILVSQFL